MPDSPYLSSEAFTLRDSLFWGGTAFYALGNLGGLVTDGFPRWSLPVVLDWYNFAVLGVAVGFLRFPRWKKTHAAMTMLYGAGLTFVITLVADLLLGGPAHDLSVYANLFVLMLFMGPAVFLAGPSAAFLFGGGILTLMVVASIAGPAPFVRQHLWFEVPGVLGTTFLLYRYRVSVDRVLADLQRVIRENKVYRERERLASLGELTAGISHEIKNPLNLVVNFAEASARLVDEIGQGDPAEQARLVQELRQNLLEIQTQGERGVSIVRSMLLHARSGPLELEVIDLNVVVAEGLRLAWLTHVEHNRGIDVTQRLVVGDKPVLVRMSRGDLARALINLCTNAFWSVVAKAKRLGTGYQPEVVVEVLDRGAEALVVVRDNGLGFDQRTRAQLFVPFFTTKPPGEGTGLGLSLAHEVVVDQHRGRIVAEGEVGRGATFTVALPTTHGGAP